MILTDEEVWSLWNSQGTDDMNMQEAATFARAIERAVAAAVADRCIEIVAMYAGSVEIEAAIRREFGEVSNG